MARRVPADALGMGAQRGRGGFYKPGEGITLHMPPLQQPKAAWPGSEEPSPAASPQVSLCQAHTPWKKIPESAGAARAPRGFSGCPQPPALTHRWSPSALTANLSFLRRMRPGAAPEMSATQRTAPASCPHSSSCCSGGVWGGKSSFRPLVGLGGAATTPHSKIINYKYN